MTFFTTVSASGARHTCTVSARTPRRAKVQAEPRWLSVIICASSMTARSYSVSKFSTSIVEDCTREKGMPISSSPVFKEQGQPSSFSSSNFS